jgi:hypothetical protein
VLHVFLSWSGQRSKSVAQALRDWLPLVIQSVHPWFSPDDIDKGARWLNELSAQLEKQRVGIICVTSENQAAPWLLFEAGALSKALDASRVCPLVLDMEPTELKGPLSQFQATRTTKTDIRALLSTLSRQLDNPVADAHLDTLHEVLWPKLEMKLKAASDQTLAPKPNLRAAPDLLTEVLTKVRAIERQLSRQGGSTVAAAEETGYFRAIEERRVELDEKLEALYLDRLSLAAEIRALPLGPERAALERLQAYLAEAYFEYKTELSSPASIETNALASRRKAKKPAAGGASDG